MQAILDIFRGAGDTRRGARPGLRRPPLCRDRRQTTSVAATTTSVDETDVSTPSTESTLPAVVADQNSKGSSPTRPPPARLIQPRNGQMSRSTRHLSDFRVVGVGALQVEGAGEAGRGIGRAGHGGDPGAAAATEFQRLLGVRRGRRSRARRAAAAAATESPGTVARQSDSSTVTCAAGAATVPSCSPAARSAPARSVVPKPRSASTVVDHLLGRLRDVLALGHDRRPCRTPARV